MSKRSLGSVRGLRSRLLLSHLLGMAVMAILMAVFANSYKSQAFQDELSSIEARAASEFDAGQDADRFSVHILEAFHEVNNRGSILALALGLTTIGGLSCATAYVINRPIRQIEKAVEQFAAGNLNARIPTSTIPEIQRLGLSINNMAHSLQRSEKGMRQMVGDLAHEIGTPLTVIEGYLEMIRDERILMTPDILNQMYEEALRLHRLQDDMLELAKVEAGHLSLNLEQFNPISVLRGLVANFSTVDTIRQNCHVRLDCPEALPDIVADRDRFKQVMVNLISNAVNYTPSGTVTVRVWSQSKKLWIAVIDTGIGISEEDLPNIFERFWRADNARGQATGGSGIGLALTKGLIERQGGEIEVESKLGQGTTFRFWLPAFQPQSRRQSKVPMRVKG